MASTLAPISKLGLATMAVIALLAVGGAVVYRATAIEAGPPDPLQLLECSGISATDTSEGAYVVGTPPLYLPGFETSESPDQVAARFAAENRLASLAASAVGSATLTQEEVYRSADRTDIAIQAADGRTIAVVTVANDNGWKLAGTVRCAG